jgi:choline dehydrogenase-like flavoprotein
MSANRPDYDAIIVGAGVAGGIVAGVLCEAGKRVLLLERGEKLTFENVPRDHLRNQRLSLYGHNAGPFENDGQPRVIEHPFTGDARVVKPYQPGYENNASCVGGGAVVYGAQAWRFMPQDFRMASAYGVPGGSSLADWPISYDDLAPFYERAEWEIGVAGESDAIAHQGPRNRPYPMLPMRDNQARLTLQRGAKSLGWKTRAVPLAINTTGFNGRPACRGCSYCVGFACPVDAKNGSHNTLLKRAIASGQCELITRAVGETVDVDGSGNAVGVTFFDQSSAAPLRRSVTARKVVVSSGAIESARLLLNSISEFHPHGIGNAHDMLGRNLDGHVYTGAIGIFNEIVIDSVGPGASIATSEFNHDNPGIVGGGMIANEFVKLPIMFWRQCRPPDIPTWGQANKDWMRTAFLRTIQLAAPIHDIPSADSRVRLDPNVRDKFGIPAAHISGAVHPETLKTASFVRQRAEDWLRASGAKQVWSHPNAWWRSGGQHQIGTCRMGNDRKISVCDSFGRVHGTDNLHVIDGSLHTSAGGFNPVLTIMAIAFRASEELVRGM